MPADLVPHPAIPELAKAVSPKMLELLRYIQQAGFILDGQITKQEQRDVFQKLAESGLVDPVYEGDIRGPVHLWTRNANGKRVLSYLSGIRGGPHYEIPSRELAGWLDDQGENTWWNVDGDPLLTGMMIFPCPSVALGAALRKINQPLLVQARQDDAEAKGQIIGKEKLNDVVGRFSENLHVQGDAPAWGGDRLLYLCWKGKPDEAPPEWLLAEDSEAKQQLAVDTGKGTDSATVIKRE